LENFFDRQRQLLSENRRVNLKDLNYAQWALCESVTAEH
jgi:hypothetical protein